ncbi:MAG: outer membrane protein [Hoeflea sp.]|uniref:outer membrane protein n=1 Tax=Hoeflea sp. TaxID=1940281 RepID=UPI00329A1899|tara:strand:+ start:3293 stop:4150 length:858 start_codon:yes stop_codon:yes gene_type:complete
MKKIFLATTAMVFAGVGSAAAADILPPPIVEAPVYEMPAPQPVAAASGWYLRGDVGYSWNEISGAEFFQGGSSAAYVPFATTSLRSSYSVGAGVGYKVNRYLRTDVTLDYFGDTDFRGSTQGGCGTPGLSPCTSTDISTFSAISLLANAYVDLGTYGRFTPYVGAGIGGTRVDWKGLSNTSCSNANPALCDPTVTHSGEASWRFTYALMAGASVDLTCNLKADVGYRYRHIEGGKMFGYALNGGPGYDKSMSSHEVRGGLRYGFNGCAQEEVYIEPAPIMPAVYK